MALTAINSDGVTISRVTASQVAGLVAAGFTITDTSALPKTPKSFFDDHFDADGRVSFRDLHAAKNDPKRTVFAYVSSSDLSRTLSDILGVAKESTKQTPNEKAQDMRKWAKANGIAVSERGAVSAAIEAQYDKATAK